MYHVPSHLPGRSLSGEPAVRLHVWMRSCVCCLILACSSVPVESRRLAASSVAAALDSAAVYEPARNSQLQSSAPPNSDSVREQRIAEENKKLLELAIELKAQLEKTSPDTLSLEVVRKAEQIERLARMVKETTKLDRNAH